MTLNNLLIIISLILVGLGFALYLYFSFVSKLFFRKKERTTPEIASTFGEFINGLTGPIFALGGFLIIYATIMDQNDINNIQHFESLFYKQMDYHRDNNINISIKSPKTCEEIKGGAVWVSFYSQIKKAYQIIENDSLLKKQPNNKKIDLAFATFYFGISNIDTIRLYSHFDKLNLTNESKPNYFSNLKSIEHCQAWKSYFPGYSNKLGAFIKQYFSFISYVDNQKTLTIEQKKEYTKLLHAQNDNYCEMVLYFYLESSLCEENEHKMILKYNLLPELESSLLFHLKTNTAD